MNMIRIKRMQKELLKLVSNITQFQFRDKHFDQVTITAVSLSPDFSVAKIYFTDLSDFTHRDIIQSFEKGAGYIKNEIAKAKLMRTIPELHFFYDEIEEKAAKLDQIFQQIHTEEEEKHQS